MDRSTVRMESRSLAGLDGAALDRLLDDLGPAEAWEILHMYRQEATERVTDLLAAIPAGVRARASQGPHTLRSISAVVGAREVVDLSRELEALAAEGRLDSVRERVPLLASRVESAISSLTALEIWLARESDQPDWLVTQLRWADTVNELHDQRAAARLREILRRHHRVASSPSSGIGGLVGPRLAGLATTLGRSQEADAFFAESAGRSKELEMRSQHAAILIAWARFLSETRTPHDHERARLLLYEALVTAERHHASAIAAQAWDLLQHVR